jgi:hypothetical protein
MSCNCNCGSDHCRADFVVGALPLLVFAAVAFGAIKLIGVISANVSLPPGLWIPLGVGATLWGLWLGFTHHRRGEPLAIGIFGLVVTGIGFVLWVPLAMIGAGIVLIAAVWSSRVYAGRGAA